MGVVYRAEQTAIQRAVALKVLHPKLSVDPTLPERFRNEAALASRLNHPNTVTIFDFGFTDQGAMYIAMEYVEGSGLDVVLGISLALPWKRVCYLTRQICGSLQDAHDKSIIHRDLKPENVMITSRSGETDVVKVLDFGIAKIMSADSRGGSPTLTAPNEVFGTPDYMSPEQVRGDRLDHRSDLYSLGIIAYRMLTGQMPFAQGNIMETMVKRLIEDPIPLSSAASGREIPDALVSLVMQMLARDRDARPGSMGEVARLMGDVLSEAEKRVPPKEEPVRTPPKEEPVRTPPKRASTRKKREQEQHKSPVSPPKPERTPPSKTVVLEPKGDVVKRDPLVEASPVAASPAPDVADVVDDSEPDEGKEDESGDSLVDRLLERMKNKGDFPAVSANISQLNAKVSSSMTSAPQLANVILNDYSLTTRLLKLINSPFYGQVRGRVTTVSRAVVLMGFEAVREAGLGLMLFDHLKSADKEQAGMMMDEAVGSLVSGLVARSMASDVDGVMEEEAFVCSMFHNLGRHIALFYFEKEADEIRLLLEEEGMDENVASQRVLGISFEKLGKELAKRWGFPEQIVDTMSDLSETKIERPREKSQRLHHLVGFSEEFTKAAAEVDPELRKAGFSDLATRYGASFRISEEQLEELLERTAEQIEEYAEIMDFKIADSKLASTLCAAAGGTSDSQENEQELEEELVEANEPTPKELEQMRVARKLAERESTMMTGVEEVAAALKGRYDLNTLMLTVLETMYRGLGLSRVIFCLHDVRAKKMCARSGFGESVDELIPRFAFSPGRGRDLFSKAMVDGRDVAFGIGRNRLPASMIPTWYRDLVDAKSFLLYPILIKRFPAALIYGDLDRPNAEIDKVLMDQMKELRDLAAQAIHKSHRGVR